MILKDAENEKVGRLFDKDQIARLRVERAEQIERLGHTVGHKELVRFDPFALGTKTIGIGQKLGKRPVKIAVALFRAILQKARIALGKTMRRGPLQQIQRQDRQIGLAHPKVDHPFRYFNLHGSDCIHRNWLSYLSLSIIQWTVVSRRWTLCPLPTV